MILLVHFSLVVLLLDSRLARDVEKPFIAGLAGGGWRARLMPRWCADYYIDSIKPIVRVDETFSKVNASDVIGSRISVPACSTL